MAYNHLGVTEKEYFGLQHGDESVDSPVSIIPVRRAGLVHSLVLQLMFSYPTEMAGIKQTHQKAVKRWVWPAHFSWTLGVSVCIMARFSSLIISVPITSGTWTLGGLGDVSEPTSPCLISEWAEMLPNQPPRLLTSCEQGRERWKKAAKSWGTHFLFTKGEGRPFLAQSKRVGKTDTHSSSPFQQHNSNH